MVIAYCTLLIAHCSLLIAHCSLVVVNLILRGQLHGAATFCSNKSKPIKNLLFPSPVRYSYINSKKNNSYLVTFILGRLLLTELSNIVPLFFNTKPLKSIHSFHFTRSFFSSSTKSNNNATKIR
jgi:hypothetical protein